MLPPNAAPASPPAPAPAPAPGAAPAPASPAKAFAEAVGKAHADVEAAKKALEAAIVTVGAAYDLATEVDQLEPATEAALGKANQTLAKMGDDLDILVDEVEASKEDAAIAVEDEAADAGPPS